MHKKSFTFGLATGILLMVVCFYAIYGITLSAHKKALEQAIQSAAPMTDEEIIWRALQLQLQKNAVPNQTQALPSGFSLPPSPIATQLLTPLPPDNVAVVSNDSISGQTMNNSVVANDLTPTQFVLPQNEPKTVTINIAKGMTASEICRLLQTEGLVEDADEFHRFLVSNKKTHSLAYGRFDIKKGLSFQEMMNILINN